MKTTMLALFAALSLAACSVTPIAPPADNVDPKGPSLGNGSKAAKDDLLFSIGSACPHQTQGNWVAVKNISTQSRVYATLQIDSNPSSYPIRDLRLAQRTESTPIFVGFLLLPGESRRVGCSSQRITGTFSQVAFSYSSPGAYYPSPDTVFPAEPSAEQFVRFLEKPGYNGGSCEGSGTPTGHYFMRNAHPTKILQIRISGMGGNPDVKTFTINPEEILYMSCNNVALDVKEVKYFP